MKIAVTGAGGFIGCNMVSFLKDRGYFVRAIIRKDNDLTKPQYAKADEVVYCDFSSNNNACFKNIDVVYHFAANMGGVGFFTQNNYQPFVDNIRLDINVLEACRKMEIQLFYPSSACAYPIDAQQEDVMSIDLAEYMLVPANSDQMYGWEKLMMILLSRQNPLVRVGILNTIFGEYQHWHGDRVKFPPAIVRKVINAREDGKPISIWGDGNQRRTFLYIEDALEKIYEVMTRYQYFGEVNIASDDVVTVKECADWVCEFADITPKYKFDLSKPSGVITRKIDNSKFYKHYKYRNKFTTQDGFYKLYNWMSSYV